MQELVLTDPATLSRLAAQKNPDVRNKLALVMADTCAACDMGEGDAGRFVGSLLTELARAATREVKLRLAQKLSPVPWAPRELIVTLANDEIDIAETVIAISAQLLDADLIDILANQSQAHKCAVARRPSLSPLVCDAIASTKDPILLTELVANASARVTRHALSAAVEASGTHTPLRAPLAGRPELTQHLAERLYLIAGEEVRKAVARRFAIDEAALSPIVGTVLDEAVGLKRPSRSENEEARSFADRMSRSGCLTPELIVRTAASGQIAAFDHLVAVAAGLPASLVRQALETGGVWAGALACRAAGVDAKQFPKVHAALAQEGRAPKQITPDDARAAANAFTTLSTRAASDALRRLGVGD